MLTIDVDALEALVRRAVAGAIADAGGAPAAEDKPKRAGPPTERKAAKPTKKEEAPAEVDDDDFEDEDEDEDEKPLTRADVKSALQAYAKKHDKPAAVKAMKDTAGVTSLSELEESDFPAVIKALAV